MGRGDVNEPWTLVEREEGRDGERDEGAAEGFDGVRRGGHETVNISLLCLYNERAERDASGLGATQTRMRWSMSSRRRIERCPSKPMDVAEGVDRLRSKRSSRLYVSPVQQLQSHKRTTASFSPRC